MGRHEEALKILHGGTVIPAIPLVLDENRKFNEAGQRTLIRYYLDAGVGGLAVAVHTTQFEIRKPEVGLFEPVLRVTKEEMDAYEARTGKTLVRVAGACGEAEQACAEARTAKALGFDAVLLSPGGLAHRTEEELVERTHAVAAEMPVIGFYLQTACGGRRLSYEYWKAVADSLAGSVCLLAAPAEEYVEIGWRAGLRRAGEVQYLGGKQQLIAEGAFDDIDMAMMVHSETDAPQPRAVVAGAAGGFIGKELRFLGKEAHAGGAPWEGVNALNAASLAIAAIHANRETFRDEDHVRVHPIITKGGDLVNTVPADVRMESYVRAASVQAMRTANAKVNRAARGAAYAVGARVEIDDMPGYLPLAQNAALSELFAANVPVCAPGLAVERGLPFCGSTDMGDVSYLLPVIQPTVSGFSGAAHSRDFAVADEALAYLAPAKLMAATVIDLLAGGAAKGRSVLADAPRRTRDEYSALWRDILAQPGEG